MEEALPPPTKVGGFRAKLMKLTFEQAEEIRKEFATEKTSKAALGRKYNISEVSIRAILSYKRYTNPNINPTSTSISTNNTKKTIIKPRVILTFEQANSVREDYNSGKTNKAELARKYNVCAHVIKDILDNKTHIFSEKLLEDMETNNRKLTFNKAELIRIEFAKNKVSKKYLAKKYDVSEAYIKAILNNRICKK